MDQQVLVTGTNPPPQPAALPPAEFRHHLAEGWRYVRFEYCVSVLVATVRRQSRVYLTESWQQRYLYGLGYSILAVLLGPWGVPWGLAWTCRAVWTNFTGGVDVTEAVRLGGAAGEPG